jgi:hypothetical protein
MDLPPPPPPKRRRATKPVVLPDPSTLVEPEEDDGPPPGVVPDEPEPMPALSAMQVDDLREMVAERARRMRETLRLFEPTPEQERFFACESDERLAIGGNRGGKTTTVMVEIARAVTGQDPHDKYPKEDGVFILVAKDLGQCARVFYRKLFMAGALQIIKDAETRQWRTFRPNDPDDVERQDEAKPAPPLIPPRLVKSISWENKKERIPKSVHLKNGWEIWFFSSAGEWPQGVDVDGVAFDEEIERSGWYAEMSARLADRRRQNRKTGKVRSGKFMWSATPQSGTIQLYELYTRANEELAAHQDALAAGEEPPPLTIQVFEFGLMSNPYIAQHAKDALIRKFAASEEEYAVRVEGKFALMGMKVYPEYTPKGCHGIPVMSIPPDWTRYCAIDPGRQVCAVLFAAVPPPGHPWAGRAVVHDELYIRRCDAKTFARRFKERIGEATIHQAIIDMRAGRIREIGSGVSHEEQYRRALAAEGVKFGATNSTAFVWSTASGSDDVKAGIEAVRVALALDDANMPRFLFMREKLPNLNDEIDKYAYKKGTSGVITDEPLQVNNHLCDCLRYLAMGRLKWVKRKPGQQKGYTNRILEEKRRRKRAAAGDSIPLW